MNAEKIQQFNMLQDVITEFSDNPSEKRSIKNAPNSVKCSYNPPDSKPLSKGCAIGMYLPVNLARKLDRLGSTAIEDVMVECPELLPKWLREMDVTFLQCIQTLHDDSSYWNEDGLTELGMKHIKFLCAHYGLSFDNLKFN